MAPEIIPPFLDRLGVKHIALGSHSVGAVYALNIVLHLRQYLHPKAPYIALMGRPTIPLRLITSSCFFLSSAPPSPQRPSFSKPLSISFSEQML